jgi:hypothetical protein
MELALQAEIYYPILNEEHNYVDKTPSNIAHGIRCPCSLKKDKVFITNGLFSSHTKTKRHQAWLAELNTNKINYIKENEELKKTVENQRKIISQMEKDNVNNLRTINYLTQQVMKLSAVADEVIVTNLLDM